MNYGEIMEELLTCKSAPRQAKLRHMLSKLEAEAVPELEAQAADKAAEAQEEGLEGDGTGNELSPDGVRTNMEAAADEAADATRVAEPAADDAEAQ